MSTRSCIARSVNGDPLQFRGVYHHWDGYPTGLGATLYKLYNTQFQHNLRRMLQFLIDKHPGGWSAINSADFSMEPGFRELTDRECKLCGEPSWKHYVQEYQPRGLPIDPELLERAKREGSYAIALGHSPEFDHDKPHGPECYCHGARHEKAGLVDQSTEAGMEWAYVFDEAARTMTVLERQWEPKDEKRKAHATGMFGVTCADSPYWANRATVKLDGPEPDWERLEK